MSNLFLISDPHFDHESIIKFAKRPFSSAMEMNEVLIDRWNRAVTKRDTVYCLGDWGWKGNLSYKIAHRLNGRIRLVMGNHDSGNLRHLIPYFHSVHGSLKKGELLLTHIPIILDEYRMWTVNVHGHLHRREDEVESLSHLNINMDVWEDGTTEKYAPIPFEVIKERVALTCK